MKNLFDPTTAQEIKDRLAQLHPDSQRLWGSMNVAQTIAHCVAGMQMANGELRPPRVFLGRILGPIIKPLALRNDEPMRKNSPTVKALIMQDDHDLATERERLYKLIDRAVATGRAECTTYPHAFFGRLTPDEWAILMYKHLDHHLHQFGV
jgi:hypothetical protein